jgi:hypothetical protein
VAEAAAAAYPSRPSRTGFIIREILSRSASPLSVHDIYTWMKALYRELFPRERPPGYEQVRKYVNALRKLGLVQVVGEAPASNPNLRDRRLHALTPFGASPESDPYWRDPWGALYRGELPPSPGAGGGGGGGGGFGPRPGRGGGAAAAVEEGRPARAKRRRRAEAARPAERVERREVGAADLVDAALSGSVRLEEAADLLARLLQADFASAYSALKAAAERRERERLDALLAAVGRAGGRALFDAARRYLEREVEAGRVPREAAEILVSAASIIPDPGERAYSLISQMLDAGF